MKRLFVTLPLALACMAVLAVPAKRGQWKTVTLADGTEVRVELRGDEFCHFWQAEDGRQFVESAKAGVYEPADIEAMTARAAARRQAVAEGRARRAARARKAPSQAGRAASAYEGEKKGLIVLVEFADLKFADDHTPELYNRIANEENFTDLGFTGSVRDYFKHQSYGTFDLTFDVVGPVEMPNGYAYYGANTWYDGRKMGDHPAKMYELVTEACTMADEQNPDLDFTQYDWDGDGQIDQVYILYAGHGEASYSIDPNTIWPHEWDLYSAAYYGGVTFSPKYFDDKLLYTYACGGELGSYGSLDGIGTLCHEFSHCLGLPDMYDTNNGNGYGMNEWSLMDQGSYNDNGMTPPEYTAYERMSIGWLAPIDLDKTEMTISAMPALGSNNGEGEAYIIYNDGNLNEYYLLENRQTSGKWDAYVPNSGMLITHVDYNATIWRDNTVNSPSGQGYNGHERCTPIQADEGKEMNNERGDVWPYGMNPGSLTNTSTPAAKVYNRNTDGSYYMNKSVIDITRNGDGTMSFTFTPNGSGTTGIENVKVDATDNGFDPDAPVYNLNGQRVSKSAKGILIQGGKKFVRK